MLKNLIRTARPYQYIKNLFIFLPAFFAFELNDIDIFFNLILSFISFSMIASAVYLTNDWLDRHEDILHPIKCTRPIASGKIGPMQAFIFLIFLLTAGSLLAWYVSVNVLLLVSTYLIINILYSFKLKHVAIIDVCIISIGFVLRLFVGSEAGEIYLSHWIIVMTFLLALFLSLAKRRDDVLIYIKTQKKMRKVIDGYNIKFLDSAMMMTSSIVIVSYILWSISIEVKERLSTENLFITVIFVVIGILRYMQLTFVYEKSGNPSKTLLKDKFLITTILLWIFSFIIFLYVL